MAELQRDLGSQEQLLHNEREFLREGCLQKLSRKGYQQRMFFLVSAFIIIFAPSIEKKFSFLYGSLHTEPGRNIQYNLAICSCVAI